MRAGLLTEEIEILAPQVSTNDFGEETTEWNSVYSTKARLVHTGGNRTIENDEIFYGYTKTFQIRYYVQVQEYYRILWNGKQYRILDIEPDKQQQQITIKTELVND